MAERPDELEERLAKLSPAKRKLYERMLRDRAAHADGARAADDALAPLEPGCGADLLPADPAR